MSSDEKPQKILLPKLKKGITCTFNDYDIHGKPHWMLNDPGRNKFFIIGWAEYQIYQNWEVGNLQDLIETINTKTTLNIDQTDIENFYKFLKKNYLIQQSGYDIYTLGKEQQLFKKDSWIHWFITHYLFFRIPLWHPDKFLIRTQSVGAFLFNRYVFYVMMALAFVALYQISTRWDAFTHTFASIFTWQGFLYYFIAFSFCKFCHEMGHAYMCRRYGIPVQSLGIAFLVFWPVLYTDTTLSWVLKSKKRMSIALAGIWVETYVVILAALIWCNSDNITLKAICFMVISINWLASLLINVSPFMRFDGYYILSDFLRMPNLQPRAFALTRWQIRQWLFGFQESPPEVYSKNLKRFLIAYSLTTWIYRLVLYLAIAVLVYHFFIKLVGILLFIIEMYYFVSKPFINEIQTWYLLRDRFHWNKHTVTTLAFAILLILLFFLPIRTTITLPATLNYLHEFIIAQAPGRIEGQIPIEATPVKKGDIILQLSSTDLEYGLQATIFKYQQKLSELRNAKINLADFNQKNVILSDIDKSQAEYQKLYALYEQLTLKAPFNGIINEVSPNLSVGSFVRKDEWIADITNPSQAIVEAYIDESQLKRVKKGLKGYFYPKQLSENKIPVTLTAIDTLNTNQLTCQYSKTLKLNSEEGSVVDMPCYQASELGGSIATYQTETGIYVPVNSIYRIKLTPDLPVKIEYVEVGKVVLEAKSTSYAAQVFYRIKRILVQESGF